MKLYNIDRSTLMEVTSLDQENNTVIVKGSILGSMPITCVLTPTEARQIFKLLTPKLFLFLLTFLFRS
jgi:hypothetical protein